MRIDQGCEGGWIEFGVKQNRNGFGLRISGYRFDLLWVLNPDTINLYLKFRSNYLFLNLRFVNKTLGFFCFCLDFYWYFYKLCSHVCSNYFMMIGGLIGLTNRI